jgi:D-3-phosphoglycerate dehydrogenase
VAALSEELDRSSDFKAAREYLKNMGVDYEDRETDERKGYENSITLDLTASVSGDMLRRASIRGTVTDGILMIARINDFKKLYIEPKGHMVVFTYKDRPGVLGQIGAALAKAGINIDDVRNPHDSSGGNSIAILKVNQHVADDVIHKIAKSIDAHAAFCADL